MMHPTSFSQIIGNEEIKRRLIRMIANNSLGPALLFSGTDGIGKGLFAWVLAAEVMAAEDPIHAEKHLFKMSCGSHPDVHLFRPEGKLGLHSIQSLRNLCEEVHLPPYEASRKFLIIHDAERMLSVSANALLKTFEEPPPRTVIILISSCQASLLPTIISRCSHFHFQPISDEAIKGFLKEKYQLEDSSYAPIIRLAGGSIGHAVKLSEKGSDSIRHRLLHFLAGGGNHNYPMLQEVVQSIAGQVETKKKQVEEITRKELYTVPTNQISAQQQQVLEKELEGVVALVLMEEARTIFSYILSWHRDLQLLLLGGSFSQLDNPDFAASLEQIVQRGNIQSLDTVLQAVKDGDLALQRSTSLAHCLENILLAIERA